LLLLLSLEGRSNQNLEMENNMHLPLAIRFYNNEVRFVTSADPFLCSLYPQNGLDNTPENIVAVLEALRLLPEGDEYDPKPIMTTSTTEMQT